MICSHALVGAAGQTAPTNHLEPPQQKVYVVVVIKMLAMMIVIVMMMNMNHLLTLRQKGFLGAVVDHL